MEYIKKENGRFFAMSGENIRLDNFSTFDSRVNYLGINGNSVCVPINKFDLIWSSNFGYGSLEFSRVDLWYEEIEIHEYNNINTTQKFVNLLNIFAEGPIEVFEEIVESMSNSLNLYRYAISQRLVDAKLISDSASFQLNINLASCNIDERILRALVRSNLDHIELNNSINEANANLETIKNKTKTIIDKLNELIEE